jgi:hypothetical protein
MGLGAGHKLGHIFALVTTGSQTGWDKPVGALQFHPGRRRSLACLVVSARDVSGALPADYVPRTG